MNHILFLENICMAQFRITPNIGILVLLQETIHFQGRRQALLDRVKLSEMRICYYGPYIRKCKKNAKLKPKLNF